MSEHSKVGPIFEGGPCVTQRKCYVTPKDAKNRYVVVNRIADWQMFPVDFTFYNCSPLSSSLLPIQSTSNSCDQTPVALFLRRVGRERQISGPVNVYNSNRPNGSPGATKPKFPSKKKFFGGGKMGKLEGRREAPTEGEGRGVPRERDN